METTTIVCGYVCSVYIVLFVFGACFKRELLDVEYTVAWLWPIMLPTLLLAYAIDKAEQKFWPKWYASNVKECLVLYNIFKWMSLLFRPAELGRRIIAKLSCP